MSEKTRILVVDDDPAILQLFSNVLRTQGYEVYEAATARDGLRLTREHQPALVLLDVLLPDISGVELCRHIKADKALEDVFVVLVSSAASNSQDKVEGLAIGADDYVTKTLEPAEILARIRTLLRLRNTTLALRTSERHYQQLVEVLPDAFGLVDSQGRLLAVNPQAVAMLGYSCADELQQKSIFDLCPAEDRQLIEAELAHTLETGVLRKAEHRLLKRNGDRLAVEVSASTLKDARGRPQCVVCVVRDATERQQAETILRDSVERFRQLTGCIREVFWMTNLPKTEILYISPGYEEIWGRSCQSVYESPRNWVEAIHQDDRERVLQAALTKQISGEYDEVYRIVRPDGTFRWIQDRAFPVCDPAGNVYRIVGVAADITRQKHAEERLRESEERYRELAKSSPDAIFILDREATVRYANGAAAQWLNLPDHEVIGRSQVELFPPEIAQRHLAVIQRVFETGDAVRREDWLSFPTGRKWVEARLLPLRDPAGKVSSVIGISRDLTERKRIEDDLRLLADAVQSANELICIADAENRFTFANEAFLAAYGYTLAEILGRTPEFIRSAKNPPELGDRIYRETMKGGWRGEILNCRKDGTEFPVALSTARIKNNEGKILGLVGVAQDIAERKQMERRGAAFSNLAHRLGAADDAATAADIILDVASGLFGWDASYVHLYARDRDEIIPVLTMDTISGRRSVVPTSSFNLDPSPLMRMVMVHGARLTARSTGHAPVVPLLPFGEKDRCSACLMHVPIHSRSEVIGILSIQSYTPHAYSPRDLELLQALADHCGNALHRIRVTAALREAEAKYRSIFENAVEGIFQSTPAGRYLSVNPAMARILGYETPEEVINQVSDIARQVFVRPERREEFKHAVEAQGAVGEFDSEHRRKDGSRFWMSVSARVVRDPIGGVLFYEGTAVDITERKWAEELRQIQRDFGIFLGSASEIKPTTERLLAIALQQEGIDCGAVFLVDGKTDALELVAQEGLSARFTKHRPPPDPKRGPAAALGTDSSMAGLVAKFEHEGVLAREILPLQHKGRVVAVLSIGSHLVNEIPVRTLHAIDTIAAMAGGAIARIHAEQSLQANQQLLEKTLHGLSDAVFIMEAEPVTILECNPAASRIFGYSRGELIGGSPGLLHVSADKYERFSAAIEDMDILSGFEYPMKHKDGTVFPAEHHVMPIRDPSGRVVNWVGVIRDLTEVKRTEEGLRTVSRRIIEAQETERQRVARDLHDGVNQIIASAKLRLRSVEANVGAQNPAARLILGRCSRLLVQALEENRRIAHDLRPSDLDQLGLRSACRSFCKEFQARTGLNFKCQVARQIQRLPPVVELGLFRIMQESLTNVEKHARAKSASLSLSLDDGSIVLRIRDDGRGFDPARSTIKRGKWIGIGLTNMRERAATLGGTCEVKSALKRGTTITVTVPAKDCV